MKVTLLNYTPDPEKTVTLAAKLCYSDSNIEELEEKIQDKPYGRFLSKILDMGHLSVLEHASFVFGIDGISRATSHQLVRHRLASYSQQSQRYVRFEGELEAIIPPSVIETGLSEAFSRKIAAIHEFYKEMVTAGVPQEDARYILPNAATTKIIVTMNARELLHFFLLRCCERAQWEIRELATRMLRLAKKQAPNIFKEAGPACVKGPCSEGKMTCGKPKEIKEKFNGI